MIIHYVSGSRADFGLMKDTLQAVDRDERFNLSIVLAGQALIPEFGDVEGEVQAAELSIAGRVPAHLSGKDGLEMALAFAAEVKGFALLWSRVRPDLVLLLGDRGEMLAAAVAAFHLEIAIGHLHGGERSGTLDDGFRHAISKLANYHFAATDEAAERLVRMGEDPAAVTVVGAPGLVELGRLPPAPEGWLAQRFGLPKGRPTALVLFHPVVQEADQAFEQARSLFDALDRREIATIVLRPNSDAGGREIERAIATRGPRAPCVVLDHLTRREYLLTLGAVDLLIGNSSSGIIESASVGTPCVNVGSRQDCRQRNANVVDCPLFEPGDIDQAIGRAMTMDVSHSNLYGDGMADRHLLEALARLPRTGRAPKKRNAY
jgi:GDP/UDP-N,N'-diacetylbacillosamine 2-epimerase (hydrolysing)